jgi:pimeloyl-ACP methyl ester carboxylesterase
VGFSLGGFLASLVAAEHPEFVRSLTLMEPAIGSLLADSPEGKALLDDRGQGFAPIVTAVKAGDAVQATKLLFAWVTNQEADTFDAQPEALHQMILDNAGTVPLFMAMPPPPAISCATLSRVKAPTLVVRGEQTRQYYILINEIVGRCIPGSHLVTIPKITHLSSYHNPKAFNEALLQFLAQH